MDNPAMTKLTTGIIAAATAAAIASGAGYALASASQTSVDQPEVFWCYNTQDSSRNYVEFRQPLPHGCAPGYARIQWPGDPAATPTPTPTPTGPATP